MVLVVVIIERKWRLVLTARRQYTIELAYESFSRKISACEENEPPIVSSVLSSQVQALVLVYRIHHILTLVIATYCIHSNDIPFPYSTTLLQLQKTSFPAQPRYFSSQDELGNIFNHICIFTTTSNDHATLHFTPVTYLASY